MADFVPALEWQIVSSGRVRAHSPFGKYEYWEQSPGVWLVVFDPNKSTVLFKGRTNSAQRAVRLCNADHAARFTDVGP